MRTEQSVMGSKAVPGNVKWIGPVLRGEVRTAPNGTRYRVARVDGTLARMNCVEDGTRGFVSVEEAMKWPVEVAKAPEAMREDRVKWPRDTGVNPFDLPSPLELERGQETRGSGFHWDDISDRILVPDEAPASLLRELAAYAVLVGFFAVSLTLIALGGIVVAQSVRHAMQGKLGLSCGSVLRGILERLS